MSFANDADEQIFAVSALLSIAIFIKLTTEWARRGPGFQAADSYLWYRYLRTNRNPLSFRLIRVLGAIAVMASLALLAGSLAESAVCSGVAASFLAVWFGIELAVSFKFHVCFLLLCCVALASRPALGALASHPWPALTVGMMLAAVTTAMYVTSAIRKIASLQFRSGDVIRLALQARADRGAAGASLLWTAMVSDRIARTAACAAIVAELAIPALLWTGTLEWALALGIALHSAFLTLGPRTLVHFGLAALASYPAFPAAIDFLRGGVAWC